MSKSYLTIVFLLFAGVLYAQNMPKAITSPAAAATPEPMTSKQSEGVFKGAVSKINFNLKTYYLKDSTNTDYRTEIGISTRQTLFENFLAEVYIRLIKSMSNDNNGVDLEIMRGSFQYVGTYFQLLAGRIETAKIFSTMNFYGSYTLGCQKYIDMAGFTFPLYLTGGIPEIDEVKFPPIALSFYVLPTLFNTEHTNYNTDQLLLVWQGRLNTVVFDSPVQVILNLSKSLTQYFVFNIMSGDLTLETSFSVDMAKHFQINASYAALNISQINKTSVVSAGLELHNFAEWIVAIDRIIYEQQFILDPDNFETTWFVTIENKISHFRYGAAVSNTTNRYTLKNVTTALPMTPFGQGNTYAPENITFNNTDINKINYTIYIGYEF